LYDDHEAPWPYLISARVPGIASWQAKLSTAQQDVLVTALGRQVRYLHTLVPSREFADASWKGLDPVEAAKRSSLPLHLITQIDNYLARTDANDCVFTHGDRVANHIFVQDSQLSGIIDWGDAMVADRHYELVQVFLGTFDCDKRLLRMFLDASNWPIRENFAQQAMGQAIRRQAMGLAQHHTMNVFEPAAIRLPLEEIASLDELADELFEV
jgi:aminoglycoside phosphotransferase